MWHKRFVGRSPAVAEQGLRKILNTSSWDERPGDYAELAFYLVSGLLSVEEDAINLTHLRFSAQCNLEGGEGEKHSFAKNVVEAWIEQQLNGKPEREPRRYTGRVDVFCPVTAICVECGSVSPNRILAMMVDQLVKHTITVPFGEKFHGCYAAGAVQMPFLKWKLVGEWMAARDNRAEDRFKRSEKALECLNL